MSALSRVLGMLLLALPVVRGVAQETAVFQNKPTAASPLDNQGKYPAARRVNSTALDTQRFIQSSDTRLKVNTLDNVLNPSEFPGADLGAQIIAALNSSTAPNKVVHIYGQASPYIWSTPVIIDPRRVSIIGDGSAGVSISCTATSAPCLSLYETTFTIDPGGEISGFSILGNGLAGQIGIRSAGVQAEKWHDITLGGFTGSGAYGWSLNNSNRSSGWQERIMATKIRVLSGAGLNFSYNTANALAASFGYSIFDITWDSQGFEQACFQVTSGRLYASDLRIQGNVSGSGYLVNILPTAQLDENRYMIFCEPLAGPVGSTAPSAALQGTAVHVASGGKMEGTGSIISNLALITDDNGDTFTQHLRIVQADTSRTYSKLGTFNNFLGTRNTGTASMIGAYDLSNPYAEFGTIHGPYIDSTYTSMQDNGTNAHLFLSCPVRFANLESCAIVGEVDNRGNATFTGSVNFGGPHGSTIPNSGEIVRDYGNFTTTAISSETILVSFLTNLGHCSFTPQNSQASAMQASAPLYTPTIANGSITVVHPPTAGAVFDVQCSAN